MEERQTEVTINYNGQAVAVEVTLEVYEFLDRVDCKTENPFHEQRRHRGGRGFDEYIIITEGVGVCGETSEEYLCRMETLHELMTVLDTCTEVWCRRFLLYTLDGLSPVEIGMLCGCPKVAVYQSAKAVRKKFINLFKNRLNERPVSWLPSERDHFSYPSEGRAVGELPAPPIFRR